MAILSYCLWYCNCSQRECTLLLTLSPLKRKTDSFWCIFMHAHAVQWVHLQTFFCREWEGTHFALRYMNTQVSCHLNTALITLCSTRNPTFLILSFFLPPMTTQNICCNDTYIIYIHGMGLWIKASITSLHAILNKLHWISIGERNTFTSMHKSTGFEW